MTDWTTFVRDRLHESAANPAREIEIVEELAQHLAQREAEFRAGGSNAEDARRRVIDELPPWDRLSREIRLADRERPMAPPPPSPRASPLRALIDDGHAAVRRVARRPGLALVAAGTLAFGIGASTAVFTIAHNVLYAAPPFRDPGRIVALKGHEPGARFDTGVSAPDLADYRAFDRPRLFDAAALTDYVELSWTGQSLPGFDGSEVLRGLAVTREYFRVFDQKLALGRGFSGSDDPVEGRTVVISHSLWQRRFGGRGDILGQTLTLDGVPHAIVGVAGERFLTHVGYEVLAWVVLQPSTSRASRQYSCFARLAPGVSIEQTQQGLDAIGGAIAREFPASHGEYRVRVEPLLAERRAEARPALLALSAAVACLMLIAAANVACLLLARATGEARDMAVRVALGASRIRLLRMALGESLVLAALASTAGAALGAVIVRLAQALMPASLQFGWAFALDARVVLVAAAVAAGAGVLAGLAPAFETFRSATGGLRPSVRRSRVLRALVSAEVALAVLLLIGGGLLAKSFVGLVERPLGYDVEQLLGMRVRLEGPRYATTAQKAAYWAQLLERVNALPGVARAATVSDLPMGWQYIGGGFDVDGHAPPSGEGRPSAHRLSASPGYFATVGIPILEGRAFSEADGVDGEPVAIVNDLLAGTFWPGQDPIGKRVRTSGGSWLRVVGVARRIRHGGPQDEFRYEIYRPYGQSNMGTMFLVVRAVVPPESLVTAIRATLAQIDPDVPAFEIRTVSQALTREIAGPRLPVVLLTAFAAAAIGLAGLGLFGVIGYWVARRVREIGVRAALGARAAELRWLVLREGLRLSGIGVILGVAGALATMPLLRSQLYGMSEGDVSVYAASVTVTIVVAVLACWIPAARASRVDPAVALRQE